MSIDLDPPPEALTKHWSPDDAAALTADAEAYPREIGESPMLDLLVRYETSTAPAGQKHRYAR